MRIKIYQINPDKGKRFVLYRVLLSEAGGQNDKRKIQNDNQ